MNVILRIAKLYLKYWRRAVFAYLCVFCSAAMAIAIPRLIGSAIDFALNQNQTRTLLFLSIGIALAGILRAIFSYGQAYLSEFLSQTVAYDLRNAIFNRLQRLSYAFHDQSHTGQLMSRATSDVEGVRLFVGAALIRGIYYLLMLIVITTLLFTMNWKLALIGLSVFPIIAIRTNLVSRKLRAIWMKIQQSVGDLGTIIQENLVGAKVVRAFGREEYENNKFSKQAKDIYRLELQANRIQAFNTPFMTFLLLLATGFTLWYGGKLVINDTLTVGQLTQFVLYLVMLSMPVRLLSWLVALYSRAASCGQRIFEIIDQTSAVQEKPQAIELEKVKGEIQFNNVSFSYYSQGQILKNINMEVHPGQVMALVGLSGSGKSTVANLIPRFYDVTEGKITIDGIDIRDVSITSLRKNIGIVQQDTYLFSDTILENIRYGRPGATKKEIEQAAQIAHLHDFIMTLPQGYDTYVGERGVTLSGGQKQRLAIARTVLLDPRIIIMDDSTSSVDAETEYLVQQSLNTLLEGRTTVIIAQRLRSILMADSIVVLENGEVTQQGTHEELINEDGIYRKLYNIQFSDQANSVPVPSLAIDDSTIGIVNEPTNEAAIIPEGRLKGALDLSDDVVFGKAYDSHVMSRLIGYLTTYKYKVVLVTLATLLHTLTTLATPLLVGIAIDRFMHNGDSSGLNTIALIFIINAVLNLITYYIQLRFEAIIGQSILLRLRNQLFAHIQRLSMSFFDSNEVGRIMSRVQNDAGQLQDFLSSEALSVAGDLLILIGTIVWLLILNWKLALIAFIVVPLLLIFIILWQKRARLSFLKVRQAISSVNGALQESITGVRVIQSLSREDLNLKEFEAVNRNHFKANINAAILSAAMMPVVEILMATSSALVIYFGGNMVLDEVLLIGTVVSFTLYIQRFFDPIRTLTMQYAELQRAMASGSRVFEMMDINPEVINKPDGIQLSNLKGEIKFENVSFSYIHDQLVLNKINLTIKPGETIAIVGPTGAGKTTIINLIMRFYDVTAGKVLLDNMDVREVDRSSLVSNMGLVLQEPFLFSGTINENIRYGRLNASDEDIIEASKIVGAHDFIGKMEKGYNTLLQERGQNLSMGQRQLISFARAILTKPAIILLDEATANVDSYSEFLIQEAMGKLLKGRTAVIIAHRLSTVKNADRIIVIDKGKIVEQGTHSALIAKKGLYSRLYKIAYAHIGIDIT